MESLLLIIGAIAGVYLLMVYGFFSWGYVAFKFWYWFLLPVFPILPHIGFYQMVGLMVFITILKSRQSSADMQLDMKGQKFTIKKKPDSSDIAVEIAAPWITLFIGWLIKLLI